MNAREPSKTKGRGTVRMNRSRAEFLLGGLKGEGQFDR